MVSEVGALSLTSRLEETMSLSCYGLCYHNSNKKNFKSSLQSCQSEVNYGLYNMISILRVSLEVLNTFESSSPKFITV
ncbi:Uncharacterised protein [Enterobacter hormaechei]|nr:hypothetical protein [Escherichia coli]MBY5174864.1 hypothetical protein [Enterobacter hormaechei]RAY59876.1 hypothetical protein DP186_07295 [Enterobacter hormaechei subsp. xiangfangensis]EFE9856104.1 hypothetical protein [Escherichia coli]EFN5401026.1 hypothetical protein [Escherichia coli]